MSDREPVKAHRNPKTTRQQFCLYLDELEKNKALQNTDGQLPEIVEESWNGLCTRLNSSGGPRKTIQEWKKVFTGWKYSVRKKARQLLVHQKQTGGGPPEKPLTDIEQRLITITGQAAVMGITGVEEMGLEKRKSESCDNKNAKVLVMAQLDENHSDTNEDRPADDVTIASEKRHAAEKIAKPVTKKKHTLTTSLQCLLDSRNTANSEEKTLADIATSLRQLVKIEKKKSSH